MDRATELVLPRDALAKLVGEHRVFFSTAEMPEGNWLIQADGSWRFYVAEDEG